MRQQQLVQKTTEGTQSLLGRAFQHSHKQPGTRDKEQGSEKATQAGKGEGQLQRTAEGLRETERTLKRNTNMDFNTD